MTHTVPTERWEWGLLLTPMVLAVLVMLGDRADLFVRFQDPWYDERGLVRVERVGDRVRLDNRSSLPVAWYVTSLSAETWSQLLVLDPAPMPDPMGCRQVAPGGSDDVPAQLEDRGEPVSSAHWGLVVTRDGQQRFAGECVLVDLDPAVAGR